MAVNERCTISLHRDAAPGYRMLALRAPRIASVVSPGQFVHVKVPGLEEAALRRPFSVFDAEPPAAGGGGGTLTLLYKVVGRGTEALARAAEGEEVEVVGPLGSGFPVECGGVPLLVGGGYGVAPLHFLARRLVGAGKAPRLFVGGRTAGDLLELGRFAAMGVEVFAATDDGSYGAKGFAVVPLDAELRRLRGAGEGFELFACGPDGLLRAVADRALSLGVPGWISCDRHMVCGVGACFACIQRLRRADGEEWNARCCVDGPVFRASEMVW